MATTESRQVRRPGRGRSWSTLAWPPKLCPGWEWDMPLCGVGGVAWVGELVWGVFVAAVAVGSRGAIVILFVRGSACHVYR